MNKEELVKLREQILSDIVPLVVDNADSGPDRFSLLLRLIQAGGAPESVYKRAYESAKQIDNTDDRLSALLSLVDEIDFDTNQTASLEPDQPKGQDAQGGTFEHNDNSNDSDGF